MQTTTETIREQDKKVIKDTKEKRKGFILYILEPLHPVYMQSYAKDPMLGSGG